MHLNFHKKWPQNYGFEIYGNGPSYVISVERDSLAHKSGVRQGDQLLEVNGHDVTNMSAGQIKALAKTSGNKPPELEVTSCLKTHVIKPRHPMGYGFKVSNKRPVTVTSVDYGEAAHKSGLRVGDIILEARSRTATDVNALPAVLSQKRGALTLLCIPVARTSNMVEVDKTLSRVVAPDPRLYKAKDLHNKLEILLGNDYRKKMAVVAALKQYAEDRNMVFLCSALNDVLDTKSQRNVLAHIRLLIPPAQRPQFDELLTFSRSKVTPLNNYSTGPVSTEIAHHMGQRKLFQVVREADSFGFVIKSSCPSFIESVDPGGAAERAGLLPGDYIMKLNGIDVRETDHDRLVQLLRDSGSSPTLEVLRCTKVASSSNSMVSSSSSLSSHNSVDNILYSSAIIDKDGNTFTEKAQFLLTPKEQNILKKAIRSYIIKRDVIELHSSVSAILDAPSKKMLWAFLFVLLSTPHREYVSNHVNIPFDVLMGIVKSEDEHHSDVTDAEKMPNLDKPDPEDFPPSFEQHTDFLLTSVEKLQFKKSLEKYKRNHEVSSLMRTLESILDTPSKQTLWRHVLPHLTSDDKDYIRKRLNLHDQKSASLSLTNMDSSIGSSNNSKEDANNLEKATSAEDDILYGESQHQFQTNSESSSDESGDGVYSINPTTSRNWTTSNSMLEHNRSDLMREETQKTTQHVQNSVTVHDKLRDTDVGDDARDKDPDYHENHPHVSIIPVASSDVKLKQSPFYNQELHPAQSSIRRMEVSTSKYPEPSVTRSTDFYHDVASDSSVTSSSEDDSDGSIEARYDLTNLKYSRQTKKGSSALRDFNDGVSREMSDDDSSLGSINLNQWDRESDKEDKKDDGREKDMQKDHVKYFHSPPPPPPPPLPTLLPPPPPPLLTPGLVTQESSDKMNVKRINWEKLDNKSVQNTIWEQMSDHDLGEVIQYLELETQFSTKPVNHKDSVRKNEILIMDKKKAYNISILLAHLKMPVADIEKALYSMDEKTLSPDLLGQLLSFVPNGHEVFQYRQYNGDISLLSKPDQFAYQMSLVPDYEKRLKALKFKASFKERVDELRKSLENVRSASQELRNSKKLAHILEIILAMGNSMNKGNPRVGEAAGFRITFLTQLDVTKTADRKSSFLHVLAEAACNKFPETAELAEDLPTVEKAAKVSLETLTTDVQDLGKTLQEVSAGLQDSKNNSQYTESGDQFQEVMSHFIVEATEEIQSLFKLQESATDEFSSTVEYFGENPKTLSTTDLFGTFLEFTRNFEKAHRHNLMSKKQ